MHVPGQVVEVTLLLACLATELGAQRICPACRVASLGLLFSCCASLLVDKLVPLNVAGMSGDFQHPRLVVLSMVDAITLSWMVVACFAVDRRWPWALVMLQLAALALDASLSAPTRLVTTVNTSYQVAQNVILAASLALVNIAPRVRLGAAAERGVDLPTVRRPSGRRGF